MNKRIRKKKHVGEFDWLGFAIEGNFDPPFPDENNFVESDKFIDELIDFCEVHDLGVGGGQSAGEFGFFVEKAVARGWKSSRQRRWVFKHCTEADRHLLIGWLAGKDFVKDPVVGPLKGTWSDAD